MTWATQKASIRLRLKDPTGMIWSDALLLSYANEVIEDVTRNSELHTKHIIFPLTSGTRVYDLPSDCFEVRDVRINHKKVYGRQPYEIEDLDNTYLTATGTPEWYYIEGADKIGFYRVPSWTSDDTTTFTSEYGTPIEWTDGTTDYSFTSEYGIVVDLVSTDTSYTIDSILGTTVMTDSGMLTCVLTYVYQPTYLVNDTDTVDLPTHYQDVIVYGVLRECFLKEGQGQNPKLYARYQSRYNELAKEMFGQFKEWARGQDQLTAMKPITYGTSPDWTMRVYR